VYHSWVQQDLMILSTIISTLSDSLISQVVGLPTSQAVWDTLTWMFSSQSQAQIMQIHYQLSTIKKGNLSVTDYFQKVKQLVDTLAAFHQPLQDCETVSYLFGGLSSEYDSLVTSVTTHIDPMSLDELYGHFLSHEQRMEHLNAATTIHNPTANVVTQSQAARGRGNKYNTSRPFSPNRALGNFGGKSRGRGRGGSGRGLLGSGPNFGHNRLVYQLCQKPGRTVV